MGRLIDIDVLFDYFGNDAIDETTRSNIEYFVSEKGTVEAIPKDQYNAEMVAMLEDLRQDIIAESWHIECYDVNANDLVVQISDVDKVIQQKINSLKEAKDGLHTR